MDGVASKVQFNQVCHLFEKLQKAKGNNSKKQELDKFLSKWRLLVNQENQEKQANKESLFPLMRLIIPNSDNERSSYGIKETMMAKLYIKTMSLAASSSDAKSILEYRHCGKHSGDFADVVYHRVLLRRCISKGNLNVQQVNNYLDQIANFNKENKRDQIKAVLLELVKKMSALEQKWLIRILLKDMKLRFGQKAVLLTFHPDADDVYSVTTSLKQVCERLHDPSVRINNSDVQLFHPFRPMLAQNAQLEEVETLMKNQNFQLEIKYDGERSQVHKSGKEFKYYSRNGKEYSHAFGQTSYTGTLTPFIYDCFAENIQSCILDGEMMGYDPDLKVFVQKGGPFDIKHLTEDSHLQPCLVVFDILYLNGKSIVSTPQRERFKILSSSIKPKDGHILIAETLQASTNQQVVEYLNSAIDRREEGIIVKDPTTSYLPNKRGGGWLKIKPEYLNGIVDDFDLVIIGSSFGTGKHSHMLSMFHLGLGFDRDVAGKPQKFKSFCRVASGFTNKELIQITEQLRSKLKVFKKRQVPEWLEVAKEKPDVVIHPSESIVVQVRASEILPSTSYAAGYTLRFPRIITSRDDKSFVDACDMEQLHRLQQISNGKLALRHATLSPVKTKQPAKRRKLQNEPKISLRFKAADLSSVQIKSNEFKDCVICILTGTPEHSKQSLQQEVVANGGMIVENPTKSTFCVVAGDDNNIRVRNCIKTANHDVVKVDWLVRSFEKGKFLPWKPDDMMHATAESRSKFEDLYDAYGDCYDEDISVEGLKMIFSDMKNEEGNLPRENKLQILKKYDLMDMFHVYLFNGLTFHIVNDGDERKTDERICRYLVKMFGGEVTETYRNATHIIDIATSCSFKQELLNYQQQSGCKQFQFVKISWILECVESGQIVGETDHQGLLD